MKKKGLLRKKLKYFFEKWEKQKNESVTAKKYLTERYRYGKITKKGH